MTASQPAQPALDQDEIMAVYQQLGLASASSRAYFTALSPRPTPNVHLTVTIGSTSVPLG